MISLLNVIAMHIDHKLNGAFWHLKFLKFKNLYIYYLSMLMWY